MLNIEQTIEQAKANIKYYTGHRDWYAENDCISPYLHRLNGALDALKEILSQIQENDKVFDADKAALTIEELRERF